MAKYHTAAHHAGRAEADRASAEALRLAEAERAGLLAAQRAARRGEFAARVAATEARQSQARAHVQALVEGRRHAKGEVKSAAALK